MPPPHLSHGKPDPTIGAIDAKDTVVPFDFDAWLAIRAKREPRHPNAAGMGTILVIIEPMKSRKHFVFYPAGYGWRGFSFVVRRLVRV